jgi:hypothetical protein
MGGNLNWVTKSHHQRQSFDIDGFCLQHSGQFDLISAGNYKLVTTIGNHSMFGWEEAFGMHSEPNHKITPKA